MAQSVLPVTGTGEVADGKVHVHVVLGGEDVTAAGHLHSATVRDFFVRAYITSLDGRKAL
jgi:uncharacterized protein